jgi:hypothetical protein
MLNGVCRGRNQQFGLFDNIPATHQVRLGCALVCDFVSAPRVVNWRVTDRFPAKHNGNVVRFRVCTHGIPVMQDGLPKGGQQIPQGTHLLARHAVPRARKADVLHVVQLAPCCYAVQRPFLTASSALGYVPGEDSPMRFGPHRCDRLIRRARMDGLNSARVSQ